MKATRDIAIDLLPLYVADEASADSRELVEDFLHDDPELAALARALADDPLDIARPRVESGAARQALASTRALLRRRTWFLAAAIFCSSVPFGFVFNDHGLVFLLIRDAPALGSSLLAAAVGMWIAFGVTARRLRVTGL
jgi:hypothetical protein